jgi:flagellar biosynthesis/type III secretory pathway M-ring protein FliF/YscJ
MDAIRHPQSPAQLWARRQRRQRIVAVIIVAALLGVLVYGWLFVFGVV